MLSVVVPIYNVEAYLDECLQSISEQHLSDIQVILVNDGSTDSSPEIAADWTNRDDRFSLVNQTNSGLGAARNAGADRATGRYLAFIDSDDLIPPETYTSMVATLERTGSDIATGNVMRFDGYRTWQAPIALGMFDEERLETHITAYRELLRDLLAPNKVFRKEFWDREAIRFPEGVFYEDLPTIIPAHLKAKKVDVVTTTACLWRARRVGEASITQSRYEDSKHALDRLAAVTKVSDLIGHGTDPSLKIDYDAQALDRDVRYFVDVLPAVDGAYRRAAIPAFEKFARSVAPESMAKVSAVNRIKYYLLLTGRTDDLLAYIELARSGGIHGEPLRKRRRSVHLDPSSLKHLRIPKAVSDVTAELRVLSRVDDVEISGSELRLTGWAYIEGVGTPRPDSQKVRMWISSNADDGRRLPLQMRAIHLPKATRLAARAQINYEWTGFEAVLQLSDLQEAGVWAGGAWHFEVEVEHGRLQRASTNLKPTSGRAQRTVVVPLGSDQEARLFWTRDYSELRLQIRRPQPAVVSLDGDGGTIRIGLTLSARTAGGTLKLIEPATGEEHKVPLDVGPDGIAHATLLEAAVGGPSGPVGPEGEVRQFQLLVQERNRGRWKRAVQEVQRRTVQLSQGQELTVRRNRYGNAILLARPSVPYLITAEMDAEARLRLVIAFATDEEDLELVVSAAGRSEQWSVAMRRTTHGLECVIPLGGREVFGKVLPFRSGTWHVFVRGREDHRVEVTTSVLAALPRSVLVRGRTYRIVDRNWHSVSLIVEGSTSGALSLGQYGRHHMQTQDYPRMRTAPLRSAAVYESYWGREFSDSPAVLQREIARRGLVEHHRAVVNDEQCQPAAGMEIVASASKAYYEALATSRLVINNTHLPPYFQRRPGQLVVQTWHGIGLKHVGLDIANVKFSNRNYAEKVRAESQQWDFLISPNPFCSPILRRAFAFEGELLETGSPRNDVFYAHDRDRRAAETRKTIDIEPSRKIVLYAPTWRDDISDSSGRYRLDLHLDFIRLSAELGESYALLFRKHPNIIDSLPASVHGSVRDVSQYPEVNDLLLVTDILVTDYSTLMFDFANTGRPMIFYTYDLDHYRGTLRDFYFDFEGEAPGPLVQSEADLPSLISSASQWSDDYRSRYGRFSDRFCAWDDGHAAERVVDSLESALPR